MRLFCCPQCGHLCSRGTSDSASLSGIALMLRNQLTYAQPTIRIANLFRAKVGEVRKPASYRTQPNRHVGASKLTIRRMAPDAWVTDAAGKLVEQHGADAMTEVMRLLSRAHTQQDPAALLLMFRVGLAVARLQPDRAVA